VSAFISEFVASFPTYIEKLKTSDPLPPPERGAHAFYGGLYDRLRAQKELLLALIAADAFEPTIHEARASGSSLLNEVYSTLTDLTDQVFTAHGIQANTALVVRLSVGLVLSIAVFDDILVPASEGASRDEIVDGIIRLVFYGVTHRPPGDDEQP
jgi:hypothetical protein